MAEKRVWFEAEGPDGTVFRFKAPENSTPEQLNRWAAEEYRERMGSMPKIEAPSAEAAPRPTPSAPPMPPGTEEPVPPSAAPTSVEETDEEREARLRKIAQQHEIRQAQMVGGGLGAGVAGTRMFGDAGGRVAEALAKRAEMGRIAAQQGALPTTDQAARIMQGTPGDTMGTTGRARSTGFNIETAQQAARTRELDTLLQNLQQRGAVGQTSSQVLAQAPGMTSTPSGILVPRSAAVPPTTAPPRPSGLEQVTNLFGRMLRPAVRYAVPPLAAAGAAGEAVRAKQQMEGDTPDRTGATLSGLSALGGAMSLYPPAAAVGLPLAAGAGALQYARGRLAPDKLIRPEEEEAASRPAFGIYPRMAPRRPSSVLR